MANGTLTRKATRQGDDSPARIRFGKVKCKGCGAPVDSITGSPTWHAECWRKARSGYPTIQATADSVGTQLDVRA